MLSLLNLIIASGTVLRSDTELWTPTSFPDPRYNATQCNVPIDSTLCDPDHILTDQWRETIHTNIKKQMERLESTPILYTDSAPEDCRANETSVQIFVLLARRIQTAHNQTVNETDLTSFGDGLADSFELSNLTCKNFILLVGVEQAKLAYVRTGRHLKLPADLMERVFSQYTNLFNEKNYMEGLNKVIDEIGEEMISYFNPTTTTEMPIETSSEGGEMSDAEETSTVELTDPPAELRKIGDKIEIRVPIWIFIVAASMVVLCVVGCSVAAFLIHQSGVARLSAHLHRFVSGTENRGFDGDSTPSTTAKFSSRLDETKSSFASISPFDRTRTSGERFRDLYFNFADRTNSSIYDEISVNEKTHRGRSCSIDSEMSIPGDSEEEERNTPTSDLVHAKIRVSSSGLSTDHISHKRTSTTDDSSYADAIIV